MQNIKRKLTTLVHTYSAGKGRCGLVGQQRRSRSHSLARVMREEDEARQKVERETTMEAEIDEVKPPTLRQAE